MNTRPLNIMPATRPTGRSGSKSVVHHDQQAMTPATLYYVHDPMCSWCWGFRPAWQQLQSALTDKVTIRYVLGGLAADSDLAMPAEMQTNIRETWAHIQQTIPGTAFNFDFWIHNQPRRSTYPSCRAVIAAGMQGQEPAAKNMLFAIQQAYYLQAKNPSDDALLIQLAAETGLDVTRFKTNFFSAECGRLLQQDLQLAAKLGAHSFPSLVLVHNDTNALISIDYTNSENIVSSILTELQTWSG
jgi:putative protein-disulfide isomerase